MPDRTNDTRQIFLGNVSYDAQPEDVVLALQEVGIAVARVRLATWPETGVPRGFGFCDLDPREKRSLEEVIDHINEVEVDLFRRVLRAAKANARPPRPAAEAPRNDKRGKKKARPGGGRGKGTNEFKRGRNEFDRGGGDW
jgi:hypothetical protein